MGLKPLYALLLRSNYAIHELSLLPSLLGLLKLGKYHVVHGERYLANAQSYKPLTWCALNVDAVAQFYPWFNLYFLSFYIRYHILT